MPERKPDSRSLQQDQLDFNYKLSTTFSDEKVPGIKKMILDFIKKTYIQFS
jgi:hypothetical protein